jgi:hypothetical protein
MNLCLKGEEPVPFTSDMPKEDQDMLKSLI